MIEKILKMDSPVGVLCWKLDRLARNVMDGATMVHLLTETEQISKIVTHEKTFYPAENTLLLNIEFGMATQYCRELRNSVERGMNGKIDKGWYPSLAPIGYLNEVHALKGEKRILPHPDYFGIIKHLWETLLKQEYTLMELYRYMEKNMPIHRKGKLIAFSSFHRIFKSQFYCGLFSWRGELHVGAHKPMITQSQFERAREILTKEKKGIRQRDLIFDFKGLFKCGHCGAFITAEEHDKLVKTTGKRKKYRYYRCVH